MDESKIMNRYLAKIIYIILGIFLTKYIFEKLGSQVLIIDIVYKIEYLFAFILFLLSHLVRAYRISKLMPVQPKSFVNLICAQYLGNSLNLLLPYKLGEAFRFILISKCYEKKNLIIIILLIFEKFFDFIFLLTVFIILLWVNNTNYISELLIQHFVFLWFLLISITLVIFYLKNFRYNKNRSIKLIKKLNIIIASKNIVKKNIYKNKFDAINLTILIWILEITSFLILVGKFNNLANEVIRSISIFISSILPAGPLAFGGTHLGEYWSSFLLSKNPDYSLVNEYTAVIFLPSVIFGLIFYLTKKLWYKN